MPLFIGYAFRPDFTQHLIGDPVRDLSPDIDDLIVTLAVGN